MIGRHVDEAGAAIGGDEVAGEEGAELFVEGECLPPIIVSPDLIRGPAFFSRAVRRQRGPGSEAGETGFQKVVDWVAGEGAGEVCASENGVSVPRFRRLLPPFGVGNLIPLQMNEFKPTRVRAILKLDGCQLALQSIFDRLPQIFGNQQRLLGPGKGLQHGMAIILAKCRRIEDVDAG
ncbi:MAG: hypothetical protein C0496_18585 [Erythrobacter sp.]|nr:hypothetical protein [Erythrobacter sp.]